MGFFDKFKKKDSNANNNNLSISQVNDEQLDLPPLPKDLDMNSGNNFSTGNNTDFSSDIPSYSPENLDAIDTPDFGPDSMSTDLENGPEVLGGEQDLNLSLPEVGGDNDTSYNQGMNQQNNNDQVLEPQQQMMQNQPNQPNQAQEPKEQIQKLDEQPPRRHIQSNSWPEEPKREFIEAPIEKKTRRTEQPHDQLFEEVDHVPGREVFFNKDYDVMQKEGFNYVGFSSFRKIASMINGFPGELKMVEDVSNKQIEIDSNLSNYYMLFEDHLESLEKDLIQLDRMLFE